MNKDLASKIGETEMEEMQRHSVREDANAGTSPIACVRAAGTSAATKPGRRQLSVHDVHVAFSHDTTDDGLASGEWESLNAVDQQLIGETTSNRWAE